MKIRDLLDIKVICDTGSLRKAAEALGISQPTLGSRVARLEDVLGAALFDRSPGGHAQPTDLARFIAARVASVAEESQRISLDVMRHASGQGGLVRIGVGEAPTHALMDDIVSSIAAQRPQLSLSVLTAPSGQHAEHLRRGDIDLSICHPIEGHDDIIVSEPLLESRIIVVAHPDHPFCSRPPADLVELARARFALPFLEPRYETIFERDYGLDVTEHAGRVVCSSLDLLLKILVKDPTFVSAGPAFSFAREIAAGQLRVVATPVPFNHLIHLHALRDAYPLPAVAWVRDVIREAFAAIRGRAT